jgi:hypothetical protein
VELFALFAVGLETGAAVVAGEYYELVVTVL